MQSRGRGGETGTKKVGAGIDLLGLLLAGLPAEKAAAIRAEVEALPKPPPLPSAIDLLDECVARWTNGYSRETRAELRLALGEEMAKPNGTSLHALAAVIDKVPEIHIAGSAELLAKTILFDASDSANRIAWERSGTVKTLRWHTAEDKEVCEFCAPLDGKEVPAGGVFFNTGEVMQGTASTIVLDRDIKNPPLHLGCRCYLRPWDISLE